MFIVFGMSPETATTPSEASENVSVNQNEEERMTYAVERLAKHIDHQWVLAGLLGEVLTDEVAFDNAKRALAKEFASCCTDIEAVGKQLTKQLVGADCDVATRDQLGQVGKLANPAVKDEDAQLVREELNELKPLGLTQKEIDEANTFLQRNQRRHCAAPIVARMLAMRFVMGKKLYKEYRALMVHQKAWEKVQTEVIDTFLGACPADWEIEAQENWLGKKQRLAAAIVDSRETEDGIEEDEIMRQEKLVPYGELNYADEYNLAPIHCSAMLDDLAEVPPNLLTDEVWQAQAGSNEKMAEPWGERFRISDLSGLLPRTLAEHFGNRIPAGAPQPTSNSSITAALDRLTLDYGNPKQVDSLQAARETIITHHLPMIAREAKAAQRKVPSAEAWIQDAEQEAAKALSLAIYRYKPNMGHTFAAFARPATHGAVMNLVTKAMHRTRYEQLWINKLNRARLRNKVGACLTPKQLDASLKVLSRTHESIDAPHQEGEGEARLRYIDLRTMPDRVAALRESATLIARAIAEANLKLPERQYLILQDAEGFRPKEIALALGIADTIIVNKTTSARKKVKAKLKSILNESRSVGLVADDSELALLLVGYVPKPRARNKGTKQ